MERRLRFTIKRDDGSVEQLVVNADRVLVGSGPFCEVRLAREDAALEQLRVEARAGGVFAEARSLEPAVLLNGVPFVQGRLLPDAPLRVGRIELSVSAELASAGEGGPQKPQRSGNPLIYALGAVGFPFGFWLLFGYKPHRDVLPEPVEPPPLWATAAPSCPEKAPEAAAALALKELLQAESARERAPFSPEDGIRAVEQFERAASCLTTTGDGHAAEAARGAASELKARIQNEFHIHQVRLERALATRQYEQARTELRVLLSFVGRRGGEYGSWLGAMDRQLELKFSSKKRG